MLAPFQNSHRRKEWWLSVALCSVYYGHSLNSVTVKQCTCAD